MGLFTFCFVRRISASLHILSVQGLKEGKERTHDSFRFAKVAALSFGFFALAAAFFAAF